jgi:hypothetical protein
MSIACHEADACVLQQTRKDRTIYEIGGEKCEVNYCSSKRGRIEALVSIKHLQPFKAQIF